MQAVILAAGEGRRLEPLTDVRPKPMLPVANRPLLEHVVEAVREAGIEEIVLVVGYKRERIQNHFGDGDDWGIDIEYAIQHEQRGTGHAVLQAEPLIDDTFLALNGDRLVDASIIKRIHDTPRDTTTLIAVTRADDPTGFGIVETDAERVTSITEKPPRHAITSELVNAGVYRFEPSIFDAIRATDTEGELAITATLDDLARNDQVRALQYRGDLRDVSQLWDLLAVNVGLLQDSPSHVPEAAHVDTNAVVTNGTTLAPNAWIGPSATVLPGTAIGENVRINANAVVENSIVLPDATIGAGSVVRDCVVGANARIGPDTTVEGGPADVTIGNTVHEGVDLGAVVGDNARLGGSVILHPGAVVGTDATIERNGAIEGRVGSGATVRKG